MTIACRIAGIGLEVSARPTVQKIFRAHVFEEPLVPIGGEPGTDENATLAAALREYPSRTGPDDFASLTDFLEKHPQSPWRAVHLTGLGLDYYNTRTSSFALAVRSGQCQCLLSISAAHVHGHEIRVRVRLQVAAGRP